MVKTLLLMSLLAGGQANAASLSARLDKTSVSLGEPVGLTLQAQGISLEALDVGPLGALFDVSGRTLSRGTDSETLVLTLYPRAVGRVQIPPLQVEARRTAALPLTVTDGSDTVPRVTANWVLDPAEPRVNQPTRLTLAICDDGGLQWQRPALPTHSGRVVRALGEDEGKGEHAAGKACTLHRFHWALLATQGGAAAFAAPMLDASRFGQRLRFPGPPLSYQAAALPAWLPAHVPAVAPVVHADPLPARWPLQRPLSWRIEVAGGYSADGLKALLDLQLNESAALGVYPPLIEVITPDDRNSPLTRYAVTLFLQPRASGEVMLPALNLPWYDPARDRLASQVLPGRSITVFDPRLQLARQVLGGLAAVLLLAALAWQGRRMARWRLARRRGLRAIREARGITELALVVRQFSLTGQSAALSLGEWQRRLAQETRGCDVADAVQQMEQQLFGQALPTPAELQQALLRELAHACPKPRTPWRRARD
jgi:hypothetical protein